MITIKLTPEALRLLEIRGTQASYKTVLEYVDALLTCDFTFDPVKPPPPPISSINAPKDHYNVDIAVTSMEEYNKLAELHNLPPDDPSYLLNALVNGRFTPFDEPGLFAKAKWWNRVHGTPDNPTPMPEKPFSEYKIKSLSPISQKSAPVGSPYVLSLTSKGKALAESLSEYPYLLEPHAYNPQYKEPAVKPTKGQERIRISENYITWLIEEVAIPLGIQPARQSDSANPILAATINAIAENQLIPTALLPEPEPIPQPTCECPCCIAQAHAYCIN